MTEDGVGHREMEIDVRDRHLQEIVLTAENLTGCPGETNPACGGICKLRLLHALREGDGFADAGAYLLDRLLVVFVPGRRLPGEPGGGSLDVIAGALHLVDEGLHIGREASLSSTPTSNFLAVAC